MGIGPNVRALAVGGVVVARRNTALWGQAVVGAEVALFVAFTLVAPFSAASALIGTVLTATVLVASLALVFECIMLPFGASALAVNVPRALLPWVALGALGSLSVASGVVGAGLPADTAIALMRVATPAAIVGSAVVLLRSRRAH